MAAKTMKGRQEHRGTETILLVEDDHQVSHLTKRILERFGYTVVTAANGKEALKQYEELEDGIALVILDLIMPGMGGKECLEYLCEIDPNVRILVTSGYAVRGVAEEIIESGAKGFVCKPYDMNQILTAVREVLDSD